jgi:trimethylamine--corrinoid protein Co-methyltransferase
VNVDKLAFAAIEEVGPGGTYASSEHTVHHLGEEFYEPSLADRSARRHWEEMGMEDIAAKARRRAHAILEAPPAAPPIPRRTEQELRRRFKVVTG